MASTDGLMIYQATVDLSRLSDALAAVDGIGELAPADRVIFIHGATDGVTLPDTVASLPGVPAAVTVPIACGELNPL